MNLMDYNLIKTTREYYTKKAQYEYLKESYIREVKNFFNNAIDRVSFPVEMVKDKDVNPVLSFMTLEEIPPRLMYRFCEEYDYYAPIVEYIELSGHGSIRVYKFTKKNIMWELFKE